MNTKRSPSSKGLAPKFHISDRDDLLRHLQTIAMNAQETDSDVASILAVGKRHSGACQTVNKYVNAKDQSAIHAALERREIASHKRKAALLRMLLLGASGVEVAQKFDISLAGVRQQLKDIARVLRKGSRAASLMTGKRDPLESMQIAVPIRLEVKEREIYLSYLGKYETELEKRRKGLLLNNASGFSAKA
jgi:DNA-binding NarL/FixJ family response regulator